MVGVLASCSTVSVTTDYDQKIDFSKYKTFAFYKPGIDKAPISDLDKKRILRAIEAELLTKGMVKSSSPDVLISIFTKSKERIDITDHHFRGFWYPIYYGPSLVSVSKHTEGTLFVDILDASKKEMIWQGIGTGALYFTKNIERREARIKEFVKEIMAKFPPNTLKK
jgi:hypothetical protein